MSEKPINHQFDPTNPHGIGPTEPIKNVAQKPNLFRRRLTKAALPVVLALGLSGSTDIIEESKDTDGPPSDPNTTQILPTESFSPDIISIPKTNIQKEVANEIDNAEKIRNFISETGQTPITFEQARDIVPSLAALFAETGQRFTPDQFTDRTYVVEEGLSKKDKKYAHNVGFYVEPETDNFNIPIFKELQNDYPELEPGVDVFPEDAVSIYRLLEEGNVLGFTTSTDNVFVYLKATNGVNRYADLLNLQFDNFDNPSCSKAQPSALFASTVLHELGHLNSPNTNEPLNRAVFDSAELFNLGFKPNYSEKRGFSLYFARSDTKQEIFKQQYISGLDEFVVQHIANSISINNDIPVVTVGFNAPKDSENFQAILDQAGISIEELAFYHQHSDLDSFIIKIVDSIQGGVFESKSEKIRFGLELFAPLMKNVYGWENKFGRYFPGVDTKYYKTNTRANRIGYFPGCGLPKLKHLKN